LAAGRLYEALHLLLLYCLNEMALLRLGPPPPLTSHEIGLSVLPEIRRLGLSVIVSPSRSAIFCGRFVDDNLSAVPAAL
jgi:hypothetical protein